MPLYALADLVPDLHPSAFVAPSADLTGAVSVGEEASVWFGVVARGDIEAIVIGPRCNVQDGAVLHTDEGHPCILEEGVTVGHRAVVHGAVCGAGSLVGMGAVMLSGSRLGRGAVLAAGALLREGQSVPDGMLAVGVPARVVRPVGPPDNAARYVEQAARYRREIRPLPDPAGGRR
ncbi:gamma carbonic anhydrase family protein [Deinococcus sp. SDU3-2]|uniref:Gamma carbonic anhydrase family protein n=1 Tax=Deinococcus terrestris TaxID=2651870 RepID=A0A7X1NTS8_9DEIO|nr:gamma carbonic anhydrase family protein [Deinococcus terrestris]MPY65389.1 gamma carbonic anhydrase family protein [Deinococcus terrestris]